VREKKFYTYVWRDPRPGKNMAPIWVGKSNDKSKRAWRNPAKKKEQRFLKRVVAKIRAEGLEHRVEIS
jgi:hypothetical protein